MVQMLLAFGEGVTVIKDAFPNFPSIAVSSAFHGFPKRDQVSW